MIQVINNEIAQTKLPKTGTLSDGRTLYRVEPIPEPEPDPWAELLDKVNALTIIASKQVDGLDLSTDERETVGRVFELKEPGIGRT